MISNPRIVTIYSNYRKKIYLESKFETLITFFFLSQTYRKRQIFSARATMLRDWRIIFFSVNFQFKLSGRREPFWAKLLESKRAFHKVFAHLNRIVRILFNNFRSFFNSNIFFSRFIRLLCIILLMFIIAKTVSRKSLHRSALRALEAQTGTWKYYPSEREK